MSRNSQGNSDSQEFAFDDNLIEINVQNQFEDESNQEVVAMAGNQQQQRATSRRQRVQNQINVDNSQQDDALLENDKEQNLYIDLEQNTQTNQVGTEGEIVSFKDDVVEDFEAENNDKKNIFENNSEANRSHQSSQIRVTHDSQVESLLFNRDEEISGLNIFQRNHLQSEIKKLSVKKDDFATQSQGSNSDKQKIDPQQLFNFNNKTANNQNFEQDFGSGLLNFQNDHQQNIFQSQESQNQMNSKLANFEESHDVEEKAQKSFIHNQIISLEEEEEAKGEDDQESSNLLEFPVFESEKHQDMKNELQQKQNHNLQNDNKINIVDNDDDDDEDEEDDDEEDLAQLKNLANNWQKQIQSQDGKPNSANDSGDEGQLEKKTLQHLNQIEEPLNQIIEQNEELNIEVESNENKVDLNEMMIEEAHQHQEGHENKEENLLEDISDLLAHQQEVERKEENVKNQQMEEILPANINVPDEQQELVSENIISNNQHDTEQNQLQDSNQSLAEQSEKESPILNNNGTNEEILEDNSSKENITQQEEGSKQNTSENIENEEGRAMEIEQEEKQPDQQQQQQEPIQEPIQKETIQEEGKSHQMNQIETKESAEQQQIQIQEQEVKEVAPVQVIVEQKQEVNKEKSICEAPQTIASIFQQLAKVFQNMIIPQSMINMSLHNDKLIETQPEQFQTSATMQQQINQLQNQVTYIQNSVVNIPNQLQEVTHLLGKATQTGFVPVTQTVSTSKTAPIISTKASSPTPQPAKQQEQKETKPISKKEETEKPKKGAEKSKPKKQESSEDESESEEENESSEEGSNSENDDEEESEDEISNLKNISAKLSNNQKSKIGSGTLSSSKGSSLSFGSSMNNKKTSYLQPKTGFSAPKIITPTKLVSSKPEPPQEPSLDSITINAASIGFKEPKLFINEVDRVVKSDDLEMEDESLKPLYDYLNKLDSPSSFLIVKEQFPGLTDEQIHTALHDFKSEDKIGLVELFLPKYAKCNSARIDYYYVDMIIPPPKPKEVEVQPQEEQKENHPNKADMKIENIGDRKKYEGMSDEQLLSYQKELNLRKQALLDKKQNANPTSDRLKKIQQWNEMKEVISTVFERIGVLKGKRIQEICDDYGVKLED